MGLFKNISEGWGHYINMFLTGEVPKDVADLAEKRAEICNKCPHLEKSKMFGVIERILPSGKKIKQKVDIRLPHNETVQGYKCGQCGCAFPAMIFAKDKKCKIGKW